MRAILLALLITQPVAAADVPRATRLADNPVITADMLPGEDGDNINGPSLIRVPDWVERPLGRYYLYFAHHKGQYIRLAYADDPAGPYTVHAPGTLRMEDTACRNADHPWWRDRRRVASPDVHVDATRREIRMYFHCPLYTGGPRDQRSSYAPVTLLATSTNGLDFTAGDQVLGRFYWRVFRHDGWWYALEKPGRVLRSKDGRSNFTPGPKLFGDAFRHGAVRVAGDNLQVFFSRVGDDPERILYSGIDMAADWQDWQATPPGTVLAPERAWEGADEPAVPSRRGPARGRVRELRDPAIFEDKGQSWLLYSVAGESGIGIASLSWAEDGQPTAASRVMNPE